MLVIEQLHKSFSTPQGLLPVLQGVDLRLARGSSLALMGESGSGKSTLLHLVAGLDRADSGRILIDDDPLDGRSEASLALWRRQAVGLVFQQYNLISSLDVAANLAFQARLAARHDPNGSPTWSNAWAWRACLSATRNSSPAASSSGLPSAARWPGARPGCWPTSPPAASMKPAATRC